MPSSSENLDLKSIASLTAQGKGLSGVKYEINFVAEEKDPAKPWLVNDLAIGILTLDRENDTAPKQL